MSDIKQKLIKLEKTEASMKEAIERNLYQYMILRKIQINDAEISKSIGSAVVESELIVEQSTLWDHYNKNEKYIKIELEGIIKNL